ncbi:hypothetical protein MKZ38_009374 [Zalerion maritima]|uniref:Uncharacterized protein n=1 Tax=Zalerion maritima TaxID=339359 RepID=A0AAD5RGE8_9PEZI|nr:hypothetical protein MKZ38_009374 [Zalerion maritima]
MWSAGSSSATRREVSLKRHNSPVVRDPGSDVPGQGLPDMIHDKSKGMVAQRAENLPVQQDEKVSPSKLLALLLRSHISLQCLAARVLIVPPLPGTWPFSSAATLHSYGINFGSSPSTGAPFGGADPRARACGAPTCH